MPNLPRHLTTIWSATNTDGSRDWCWHCTCGDEGRDNNRRSQATQDAHQHEQDNHGRGH